VHLARGAARHREILAREVNGPPLDGPAAGHDAVGRQRLIRRAEQRGAMLGQ
jgi:hypothetical protein